MTDAMAHRVAGALRITDALIDKNNAHTTTSTISDLSESETAQLWQLNAFIKSEQQHLAGDIGVFHARKTKHKTEGERISLYIGPKAHWMLARFDNWMHGEEQKLASDVLAPLVSRGASAAPQSDGVPPPTFRARSNTPEALAMSLEVASIASVLQGIADAITAARLDTPKNPALAKQESMRNAVRADRTRF
jgi:hypothetical protein